MSPRTAKPAHGGNTTWAARRYGLDPAEFLDFSANINPLGTPPGITSTLLSNISAVASYPDPAGTALRVLLSKLVGQPAGRIILGNGAADLIYRCLALWRPARVIVLAPSFSEYERAASNLGIPVVRVYLSPRKGFALPAERLAATIQPGDLLFIANPNNPTGNLLARADLLELVEVCQEAAAYLAVDESFLPFLPSYPAEALFWRRRPGPRTMAITSLTKFLAIPGLRLAFGLTAASTAEGMEKLAPPWNVNALALLAGEAGLADVSFQEATRLCVLQEKEFLRRRLREVKGFRPYDTEVNFILVNVGGSPYRAATWEDRLGARGILIRNCGNFPGLSDRFIRLAVRTRPENERLIWTLKELVGQG